MLTLALETSLAAGSVALLEDDCLIDQEMLDPARRSAQTLAPTIAKVLGRNALQPGEVQLVAVSIGPGSFTGLRVGVTTAKTLAYAVGCAVVAPLTLDVIAAQVPTVTGEGSSGKISAVLDAQRQELFVATYNRQESGIRSGEVRIMGSEAWLAELAPGTVVTGPGLARLEPRLPTGVITVEPALRVPCAATVGRLAFAAYQQGRRDDLWKLAPLYLRPSAAEEKAKG